MKTSGNQYQLDFKKYLEKPRNEKPQKTITNVTLFNPHPHLI